MSILNFTASRKVNAIYVKYGVSSSSTTEPSSWSSTVPPLQEGDWLWVRTVNTNGTSTDSISYIGTDGLNGYVHVAWANSADGSVDFSTSVSTNKSYLGTYTDNNPVASQTYSDYSWSKIKGEAGTPAEVFRFTTSYDNYYRDLRSSTSNSIELKADIQGITATPYWFVDNGSLSAVSGTPVTLVIPHANNYDTVTIKMGDNASWASCVKKYELTISVIDKTEYGKWLGIDSQANITDQIYASGKPLDYYSDVDDGMTYEWNGSTWVLSSNMTYLWYSLGQLIEDPNIDLNDYNNPNTISQFNKIIALQAVIQQIFAQHISIQTGGYIKGGDRYELQNGSVVVADWTKKGFWFDYSGLLKASLQSDDDYNTYVGTGVATKYNEHGQYNTAIGYEAMYSNRSGGEYNVALGFQALRTNETGDHNVAIGTQTLYSSTGSKNVAIGYQSLYSATTGSYNVAVGNSVLDDVTTGRYNTALGYAAGGSVTTGDYNVAIGYGALTSAVFATTGDDNIAIGRNALAPLYASSGERNVAIGLSALARIATGNDNIGIGYHALYGTSISGGCSGYNNVALGYYSIQAITSGYDNVALGYKALWAVNSGYHNIGIGNNANKNVYTGHHNIAIGEDADCYNGQGAYQININKRIVYLEFGVGRLHKEVYAVLASFFSGASSGDSTACIASMGKGSPTFDRPTMSWNSGGSYYYIRIGTTDFANNSSTALTGRLRVFFINPQFNSETYSDLNDCFIGVSV